VQAVTACGRVQVVFSASETQTDGKIDIAIRDIRSAAKDVSKAHRHRENHFVLFFMVASAHARRIPKQ
jgi:hypothetical protein